MIFHLKHKHSVLQCKYCSAHGIFLSKDCNDHYNEIHLREYFKCNACTYMSKDIESMLIHVRDHDTFNGGWISTYVCNICNGNISNKDSCKDHGQSCMRQRFACATEKIEERLNFVETENFQAQKVKNYSSGEGSSLQTLSQNDYFDKPA